MEWGFLWGFLAGTLYGSFGVWWIYVRPSRKQAEVGK